MILENFQFTTYSKKIDLPALRDFSFDIKKLTSNKTILSIKFLLNVTCSSMFKVALCFSKRKFKVRVYDVIFF